MQQILDAPKQNPTPNQIVHAPGWRRVVALLFDWLFLFLFTWFFNELLVYSGIYTLDWYWVAHVLVTAGFVLYIPLMERKWQATLGKMIMRIKVVNSQLAGISIWQSLARNGVGMAYRISIVIINWYIMHLPPFSSSDVQESKIILIGFFALLAIIDFICFLENKRNQTLHDLLGNTYVVEAESLVNFDE